LDLKIAGVANTLPTPDPDTSAVGLKAFEDVLDAIVCAWVGACALEGCARPFGDEVSAIWIPHEITVNEQIMISPEPSRPI